jgi:hypothetical protein
MSDLTTKMASSHQATSTPEEITMSTLSPDIAAALAAEHRREALAAARAHRLVAALRWQRRAARAALRARIAREAL